MALHVIFTKDGIPAWIGEEPLEGSEAVEGTTVEFLAAHRRTAKGNWVERIVTAPLPLSPEETAARVEAEYQLALDARDHALREALAAEADPQFFRWQRDEARKEDWLVAVAEVKARFPKPEKP
jgi:hypothetical protein